jgi:2'-5' RNA ligase
LAQGSKYFIAIVPPSPLLEEIQDIKNEFPDKYQSRAALNSPPHITLHEPFLWNSQNENLLITALSEFVQGRNSFTVELLNFSSFTPRVIYIHVSNNRNLTELQEKLDQHCEVNLNLVSAEHHRQFRPHLTVAFRDLKKTLFFKAWEEFNRRSFSASFTVNKITLLKHNGKNWEPFADFHF